MKQKTQIVLKQLTALMLTVIMALTLPAPKSHAKYDINKPGVTALSDWIAASEDRSTGKQSLPCRVFYEDGIVRSYVLFHKGEKESNFTFGKWIRAAAGDEDHDKSRITLSFYDSNVDYWDTVFNSDIDIKYVENDAPDVNRFWLAHTSAANWKPGDPSTCKFIYFDGTFSEWVSDEENVRINGIIAEAVQEWDQYLKDEVDLNFGDLGLTFEDGIYNALNIGDIFTSGDVSYQLTSDSEVTVTEIAPVSTVSIPERVTKNGKTFTVTVIGEKAALKNKKLTSVSIPGTVVKIGNRAFCKCKSLRTISVDGSALEIVRKNAFKNIADKAKIMISGGHFKAVKGMISKATNKEVSFRKLQTKS